VSSFSECSEVLVSGTRRREDINSLTVDTLPYHRNYIPQFRVDTILTGWDHYLSDARLLRRVAARHRAPETATTWGGNNLPGTSVRSLTESHRHLRHKDGNLSSRVDYESRQ